MCLPESYMREAVETAACREIHRGLIYRIWQIVSERFEWQEELLPMPFGSDALDH